MCISYSKAHIYANTLKIWMIISTPLHCLQSVWYESVHWPHVPLSSDTAFPCLRSRATSDQITAFPCLRSWATSDQITAYPCLANGLSSHCWSATCLLLLWIEFPFSQMSTLPYAYYNFEEQPGLVAQVLIPATWKADVGESQVQGQLRQLRETLSQWKK